MAQDYRCFGWPAILPVLLLLPILLQGLARDLFWDGSPHPPANDSGEIDYVFCHCSLTPKIRANISALPTAIYTQWLQNGDINDPLRRMAPRHARSQPVGARGVERH